MTTDRATAMGWSGSDSGPRPARMGAVPYPPYVGQPHVPGVVIDMGDDGDDGRGEGA